MSVKKFRFVSPGIFINEIDNSQLPKESGPVGPVVIGRTERGPGMRPVQVNSFSEFVEIFGNPIAGGKGGDIWRDGNYTAPTYAAYAAQAWLRNATPCTVVRLLGTQHTDATSTGVAGWNTVAPTANGGGTYGLFVLPDTKDTYTDDDTLNAALAAVIYVDDASTKIGLVGKDATGSGDLDCTGQWVKSSGANYGFKIKIGDQTKPINFDRGSKKFIRNVLNTNPTLTNSNITKSDGDSFEKYFLGETYERHVDDLVSGKAHATATITFSGVPTDDETITIISTDGTSVIYKAANGEDLTSNEFDTAADATATATSLAAAIRVGHAGKIAVSQAAGVLTLTQNVAGTEGNKDIAETLTNAVKTNFAGGTDNKSTDAGKSYGLLMALDTSDTSSVLDKNQMNIQAQAPQTSWVFSQHTGDKEDHYIDADKGTYANDVTNLFKFHGLSDGAWSSRNLKLSIMDIKAGDSFNPYGTFTVALRKVEDSDNAPRYVERFTGCNLNPNSPDYVARKIGDMYTDWSDAETRYKTYGQYPNLSNFIRVEVAPDVDAGSTDSALVPFGFYGPAVPRPVECDALVATSLAPTALVNTNFSPQTNPGVDYFGVSYGANSSSNTGAALGATDQSPFFRHATNDVNPKINLVWPAMPTRSSSATGNLSSSSDAFFGVSSNKSGATTEDEAFADLVKPYSEDHSLGGIKASATDFLETIPQLQSEGAFTGDKFVPVIVGSSTSHSTAQATGDYLGKGVVPAFTLDDMVMDDSTDGGVTAKSKQSVQWRPGARYSGASISVRGRDSSDYYDTSGNSTSSTADEGTHKDVLEHGCDRFILPLVGGFDGLDIKEKEPFRNTKLSGGSATTNYAYNSVKRAIDSVADAEVVEMNLAVAPGITNASLTTHLINTCEARGDALAIIDLENDYKPSTENTDAETNRVHSVDLAVSTLKDRGINSSYGCAYFPWVQIRDSISDSVLWTPPSVVALGTMASSQRKSELWFAPAGFNRGGLTEGSAGLSVIQARQRLTSKDRDKLYEANINPIATFPSEGLVIFGQKTLQVTPSALDRINVRRLLIYLKKEVSRISAGILFDNNVPATWHRFTSQVTPLLASVKSRFGLSDFKVVLDETTTTPDLIDRNVMYAKIMLKPARAIEYIAIDFVITNTGASFDD